MKMPNGARESFGLRVQNVCTYPQVHTFCTDAQPLALIHKCQCFCNFAFEMQDRDMIDIPGQMSYNDYNVYQQYGSGRVLAVSSYRHWPGCCPVN